MEAFEYKKNDRFLWRDDHFDSSGLPPTVNFKRASLAHGNKSGPVTRLVREACPVENYFVSGGGEKIGADGNILKCGIEYSKE